MPSTQSIRSTLGALEVGAFISIFLSGIVAMQVYLYYKLYPKDRVHLKCIVGLLWVLDSSHTIMMCVANWMYLIQHFGNSDETDHISWAIAVTVALTAAVTFLVHCFFTHRIYVVSRGKKFIAVPLAMLAVFRLTAATVSTAEMIRLGSYNRFVNRYEWVFTMGLSSAVALDVLITLGLSYYLRKSKTGFTGMNAVIDLLVLYTVETGVITCVTTIASLICWVTMPHNLIFLGLHFTISKLYANTFLATLNSRATLRARSQSSSDRDNSLPMMLSDIQGRPLSGPQANPGRNFLCSKAVRITVEKTIQREINGEVTNVNPDENQHYDDRSTNSRSTRSGLVVGYGY